MKRLCNTRPVATSSQLVLQQREDEFHKSGAFPVYLSKLQSAVEAELS